MKYSVCCLLLFIWVVACSKPSADIPLTENDHLNEMLQAVPAIILDLDTKPVDSIHISRSNILGQESDPSLEPPLFLNGSNGFVKIGDTLFVGDQRQQILLVLDEEGQWARTIGRGGSGPGEFGSISGLYKNSDHIFVSDTQNSRMHLFDHRARYETSLEVIIPWPQTGVSVSDSLLFIFQDSDDTGTDHLIQMRQAHSPFEVVGSIIPRLIPYGKQPRMYNFCYIDSNSQGDTAVGYLGLPYIFLFDKELEHRQTIILDSERFDDFDNPPPVQMEGFVREFMIRPYFSRLLITDEGNLLVASYPYVYRLERFGNGFELIDSWIFSYEDPIDPGEPRIIHVHDLVMEPDALYLSSMLEPWLFRHPLN